jgi:hypothetical protein
MTGDSQTVIAGKYEPVTLKLKDRYTSQKIKFLEISFHIYD